MKAATVVLFTLISVTSCTITKRHYNKGFHVEWKKRNVFSRTNEVSENVSAVECISINATKKNRLDLESKGSLEELPELGKEVYLYESNSESVTYERVSNVPQEISELTLKENAFSYEKYVFQLPTLTHKHLQIDWEETVSDYCFYALIILVLLVIPPLLHTIVLTLIGSKSYTVFIVLEWLIWAAGIIGIIVFFSGLGVILMTCFGWNLLFALVGSAIVFNR